MLNASSSYATLSAKRNQSRCLQRLQKTYEKHKAKPLPPVFKTRIDGPSATWKIFQRLQLAATYADTCTKDCMIFSYEGKIDNNGQRMFLVAHPKHMWSNYKVRLHDERCSYEVIRENHPCKLYFDLEYYTFFNSDKDGNLMTKILIKCVIAAMFEQHNLQITESDFLWMDASNNQKFSCHLILQMNGVAFQNNMQAGIFVSSLLSALRMKIDNNAPTEGFWPSADEIRNLLVQSKNNNEIFFCDEGVYTKNRNFRIYLSTKPGKSSPLLLSSYNQYIAHINTNCVDREEAVFYDSLITYFRDQEIARLLSYDNVTSSTIQNSFPRRVQNKNPGVSGCTSSPFPNLDDFVMGIIKDNICIGFIRKWTYLCQEQKIIYDIGNYRFCHNIGRHHKSNNIKIVVDMKAKYYFQTCLDPDCRRQHFQSEAVAIPEDISFVNVPDDFFDANCFSQLPCQDRKVENVSVASNCFEGMFNSESSDFFDNMDNQLYENLSEGFDGFSQLTKMCQQVDSTKRNEAGTSHSNVNGLDKSTFSWDNFFCEDFSTYEDKNNQDVCEPPEGSSIFLEDDCWSTELASEDSSKVLLGSISAEEELLMAEAVEVTEAAIDETMFSEETLF